MSLGQIKDYTPNFNLIIPRFDIATWHDYMESNFRSIDALFFNMFGINQYRGEWQNSTTYQVGDVLFIGDPDSQYSGRLVKVLVVHTTTANDSFDVYYAHNPINYDMFMDAAAAEQAAKLARDWAIKTDGKVQGLDYSAKYYSNLITPISSEIVNVSNISNEVINVSNISANIENVDTVSTEIVTVSSKLNEIVTNSNNISSIIINSNNINDINTTANNINSINTVVNNITDIQNAATNAQIAKTSSESAQNSAEVAEFYAKNVKFGMIKELFSVNDWIQENNKYYIEYNYNIISAVYKLNQTNYELVTNIDIKDLGNKVRIYSIDRFAGFVILVNSTETQQILWGSISGNIQNQTDLQNALNTKANNSDIPTATSDLTNDSGFITSNVLNNYATQTWVNQQGFITGINSSDVTTALGYTPYNSNNPNGYITNSALTPYVLNSSLATVATSGDYDDLINKPTIPSAVTETTVSGWGFTKNIGTVTSVNNISPINGNVTLSIPTVNNATITFIQGGTTKGSFTLNQLTNKTIELDAGGGGSSYTAGDGIDITNNIIKVTNTISTGAALGATAIQPADLASVATSGNYNDLSNKPIIPAAQVNADWNATSGVARILNKPTIPTVPTNVSEFTNDAGYITNSALNGYATESYVITATTNMQTTNNLVTSISSSSTNSQYPSAKCVYDIVGDIETLINAL